MTKRNAKRNKDRTIIPAALRDQVEAREVKCADGVTRTKLFDIETGKPVIIRDLPTLDLNLFRSWLAGDIGRTTRVQKGYRSRVVPDDAGAPELGREDLGTDSGVRPKRLRSKTKRRSRQSSRLRRV